MCADTVKNIAEIFKRINLTQLATGDETIDRGCSFSTGVTSGEEPAFSSYCNDPQHTFGKIVVNVEVAIFCVLIQSDPLSTGVPYCLADRTLGGPGRAGP